MRSDIASPQAARTLAVSRPGSASHGNSDCGARVSHPDSGAQASVPDTCTVAAEVSRPRTRHRAGQKPSALNAIVERLPARTEAA